MPLEKTPHENRLCSRLCDADQQIYERLRANIEDYLLDFVAMNIRYFTSHGKRHSLGVIQQINLLLTDDVLAGLSSTETLVLLCSAWLHDVGLLVNRDRSGRMLEYKEIRARHPELGRDIIMDTYAEAGLPDHELASLVAETCYCHSRKVNIASHFPQPRLAFDRDMVRPRFLAALVRLGDALDVNQGRAPERMMRKVAEFPPDARLHWDICRILRVNYAPGEKQIEITATARKDDYQSAADYRRLFYFKFSDLADEFHGVEGILREQGLPYAQMTGYLTYYLDNGGERQVEMIQDSAIPEDEVFPLEVILFEQMKRRHLEKEQYLFAADWDYQSARLYEEEADKIIKKTGVPMERENVLQRAQKHYQQAYDLVQMETQRQPPERYFLKTLASFHAFKVRLCKGDKLSQGERLFVEHMHQVQRALDRLQEHQAFIESSTWVFTVFLQAGHSPLRSALQKALELSSAKLLKSDGNIHHGCCYCTAEALTSLMLANFPHHLLGNCLEWLRGKAEVQWRSINSLRSNKPVRMGHGYTALAMKAFLLAGDLQTARQIAEYLLDEKINLKDWEQLHPGNWITDGLDIGKVIFELRNFLSVYPDQISGGYDKYASKVRFHFEQLFDETNDVLVSETRGLALTHLMVWNEPNLFEKEKVHSLKMIVCQNIQNAFEHPVWAEDGSWGFNPLKTHHFISQALTFWEYFLLGGDTPDTYLKFASPDTGW